MIMSSNADAAMYVTDSSLPGARTRAVELNYLTLPLDADRDPSPSSSS